MTLYYIPPYKSTTLATVGGITVDTTSGIKLDNVDKIDISKPGIICLSYANPLDVDTAEFITYTSIDGTNVLVGVARGAEGITAKTHAFGVTCGFVYSKSHINLINDLLTGVTEGIKIKTSIQDINGNEVIKTPATASAVNEVTVTNAATDNSPQISATGDDTNIDLKLVGKGTGKVKSDTLYGAITAIADGATMTMDCSVTNRFALSPTTTARTLALTNFSSGQTIVADIIQSSAGSLTVVWPSFGATATMTIAAPGVVTTGKDIPTLTPVIFTTTGALPTGVTAGTVYYYTRIDATTGKLSTSVANAQAGTFITTSGSQSGVHTCAVQVRWPSQTAPTLTTGKFAKDKINFYVVDATNTIVEGMVAGAGY